uniref:Wsv220-like protein n=1 Tax=Sesarmops intermedium nimavirus TaxID=2133796 RepID=A0A401IPR4_9VIRU|nr:MAG: wsv220-like protein [Sesarmops intermedium nimavirus]GBG35606.1 wsv220-like protein [Sesarmops intermedium nimavirus]
MAGNRTELVLSMISKVISDIDDGMSQSCNHIEEALLMRVNDLKNRQERAAVTGKSYEINLNHLRKSSTPLLIDVDKELTYKKRYAALVVLNITAHYKYACVALEKILNSIRQVVVDNNFNERIKKEDSVITFRPHTLGAIRPPNPSDMILEIEKKLDSSINLDAAIVSNALEAITNEAENFRHENSINNAFNTVSVEQDSKLVSRVVEITGNLRKNAIRENALIDIINNLVSQRPVEHGVDWRPGKSYSFENLWGDNKITIKTLSTILTKSVIPNIELSNFLLYMCNHIRAVIKSVRIILFNGENNNEYFEEEQFSNWCVWFDLYNKLEWFMLAARYVVFLHSKKEMFLEEEDNQNCSLGLLAAAAESIPPNLLVRDWVEENLFSWPNKNKTETISVELLLSLGLRTSPGAKHTIFKTTNQEDYAITNRISTSSATFCTRILLGRALDEEDVGTKMMVAATEEKVNGKRNRSGDSNFLGVLPADNINNSIIESCTTTATASPFVSNPTYYFKKIWNMETHNANLAVLKRENDAIASTVLENVEPLLMFDSGGRKEWACLRLLGCCQAPALIHRVWVSVLKGWDNTRIKRVFDTSKSMATKICEKTKDLDLRKTNASSEIINFLSGAINNIQDSNNVSALAAENALWATSVWKKTTTAILSHLSSFPDNNNKE